MATTVRLYLQRTSWRDVGAGRPARGARGPYRLGPEITRTAPTRGAHSGETERHRGLDVVRLGPALWGDLANVITIMTAPTRGAHSGETERHRGLDVVRLGPALWGDLANA